MNFYELTLPLPPSINSYYGASGNRRFIKAAGVAFRAETLVAVKNAGIPKLTGRLAVVLRVFPRDKRLTDIDNRIKSCLDSLMHAGAFEDDSQVDDIKITRGPIVAGGRCEVMLGVLDAP